MNPTLDRILDLTISVIQTIALVAIGYRMGITGHKLDVLAAVDGITLLLVAAVILPYQIWGWIEDVVRNRKKEIECSE